MVVQTQVVSDHVKRKFGDLDFSSSCLKLISVPKSIRVSFLYWRCLHVLELYLKATGRH